MLPGTIAWSQWDQAAVIPCSKRKGTEGKTNFRSLKINLFYPPKEDWTSSAAPKHTNDLKVNVENGSVLAAENHSIGKKMAIIHF